MVLENLINTKVFTEPRTIYTSYLSCKGNLNCTLCPQVRKKSKENPDLTFFNLHYGFVGKKFKNGVVYLVNRSISNKGKIFKSSELSEYLFNQLKYFDLLDNFAFIPNVKCDVESLGLTPTASIKSNCMYISKEIIKYKLKPQIIIVDDPYTLNKLTDLTFYSLGRVINQPFWSNEFNCYIIPTINIEMLFTDASANKTTLENVKEYAFQKTLALAKKILDGQYQSNHFRISKENLLYQKITEFSTQNTIIQVIETIQKSDKIAIDIETTGLSPFEDKITHIAISYDFGKVFVIEFNTFLKYKELFEEVFNSDKILKIFANGHFDVSFFYKNGISISPPFADILVLNYLYRNGVDLSEYTIGSVATSQQKSKGYNNLKTLSWIYTDLGGFESQIKQLGGIGKFQNLENENVTIKKSSNSKRGNKIEFNNFELFDTIIKKDLNVDQSSFKNFSIQDSYNIYNNLVNTTKNADNYEITEFLSPIEKYNCTDADATLRIYHKLCSLIPQNLIKFHDTYLAPLIFEVLVPQYIEGFLVDVNYVDKLYSEYSGEDGVVTKYEKNTIQALKQEILAAENFDVDVLKTLYKKECPNLSFKVKSKEDLSSLLENLPINIASPEQLKILYKALGYLRGGDNTVEAPTLKYLVKNKNVKSAEYKLKFQNASKLFTTYIKPIKEMIDKDGFIHGTISAITTESGRLSSNKPNLQNIPADNVIRNCFIARPGYTFLDFDYSGIELRVVTDLADEDTFIDEYLKEDDPDLHWKMAKLIFNIPLEKRPKKENKESIELVRDFLFKNNNFFTQEELKIPSSIKIPTDITDEMVFKAISLFDNRRSFAKTLNFSILYGTTKYGLAKNLHDDFPFVDSDTQNQYLLEAQDLIDLWFKNVPKIKKWLDDTYLFAKKYGYIENRLGRRRWFLFINSNYFQFSSAEKRECWNTPVQSLASDICLSAAIRLKRFFNEHKEDGCRIVNLIHDNIISEVPKHKVDFYLKKKINIMEKEVNVMENGEKILKRVPLKVAVKVSDRWEK